MDQNADVSKRHQGGGDASDLVPGLDPEELLKEPGHPSDHLVEDPMSVIADALVRIAAASERSAAATAIAGRQATKDGSSDRRMIQFPAGLSDTGAYDRVIDAGAVVGFDLSTARERWCPYRTEIVEDEVEGSPTKGQRVKRPVYGWVRDSFSMAETHPDADVRDAGVQVTSLHVQGMANPIPISVYFETTEDVHAWVANGFVVLDDADQAPPPPPPPPGDGDDK